MSYFRNGKVKSVKWWFNASKNSDNRFHLLLIGFSYSRGHPDTQMFKGIKPFVEIRLHVLGFGFNLTLQMDTNNKPGKEGSRYK